MASSEGSLNEFEVIEQQNENTGEIMNRVGAEVSENFTDTARLIKAAIDDDVDKKQADSDVIYELKGQLALSKRRILSLEKENGRLKTEIARRSMNEEELKIQLKEVNKKLQEIGTMDGKAKAHQLGDQIEHKPPRKLTDSSSDRSKELHVCDPAAKIIENICLAPGNNFELKKLTLKPGKYYIWCNGEKAGYLMCGDWSGIYVSPDKCVSKASGMIEVLVQSSNNKELENIVSFYSPLKNREVLADKRCGHQLFFSDDAYEKCLFPSKLKHSKFEIFAPVANDDSSSANTNTSNTEQHWPNVTVLIYSLSAQRFVRVSAGRWLFADSADVYEATEFIFEHSARHLERIKKWLPSGSSYHIRCSSDLYLDVAKNGTIKLKKAPPPERRAAFTVHWNDADGSALLFSVHRQKFLHFGLSFERCIRFDQNQSSADTDPYCKLELYLHRTTFVRPVLIRSAKTKGWFCVQLDAKAHSGKPFVSIESKHASYFYFEPTHPVLP